MKLLGIGWRLKKFLGPGVPLEFLKESSMTSLFNRSMKYIWVPQLTEHTDIADGNCMQLSTKGMSRNHWTAQWFISSTRSSSIDVDDRMRSGGWHNMQGRANM
ncbi:hypothetical protein O6P43_014691 [Quillaja saponaria]|uniref:Uncharacterized protein n=1 Tax=Quillaja saponaria TaxID=32244 RepID=A0AAD7PS74_QUISA|nr:hypothetical protein O6P43_014691 [Quillaja saponaria]